MDLIEFSLILILAVALIGAAVLHPWWCGAQLRAAPARGQGRSADLLPVVHPAAAVFGWLAVSQARVSEVPALDSAAGVRSGWRHRAGGRLTMHAVLPEVPLAARFALGAVISPTDAVAVSAITERLKLPLRMTAVLSDESLIDDASGLVAFQFAVAAVVTGAFSLGHALVHLLLVAGGGVLIGVAVSWSVG